MTAIPFPTTTSDFSLSADPSTCRCGGHIIVGEPESYCISCGLVKEVAPIVEPSPFVFENGARVLREGPTHFARSTMIGRGGGHTGAQLRWKEERFDIQREYSRRSQTYDRARRAASQFDLPDAIVAEIVERWEGLRSHSQTHRGHSIESIVGALAFLVARDRGAFLPLKTIRKRLGATGVKVDCALKFLRRRIKIQPFDPRRLWRPSVLHAADRLGLSTELRRWLFDAVERAFTVPGPMLSPQVRVAAILQHIARVRPDLRIRQEAIAEAVGISSVSVRVGLRKTQSILDRLPPVPSAPVEHYP